MNWERIEENTIGVPCRCVIGHVGFDHTAADPLPGSSCGDLGASDGVNVDFGNLEIAVSAGFRSDRTYSGWLRQLRDELV